MWLPISLFCSHSVWSGLLVQCIFPFVEMLTRERKILLYHVALNYDRGENIRLSLQVAEKDAQEIALYADYYFKTFSAKAGLPADVQKPNGETLFIHFPCNSIQYGLYSCEPQNAFSWSDPAFQQEISATIFEVAKIEEVNEETIFTLAFQLHFTLLSATLLHSKTPADELLREAVRFSSVSTLPGNLLQLEPHLQKNKVRLSDIAYDIMNQNGSIPPWLMHWHHVCTAKVMEAAETYYPLTRIIYEQLGINEYLKSIIVYYMRKSIAVYR